MSHDQLLLFSQAAGFEPELTEYPELAGTLIFGPLVPSQFRLNGHGKMKNAEEMYRASNANKVNGIKDLDQSEIDDLKVLALNLKNNKSLQKLAGEI